jgi:flagellin
MASFSVVSNIGAANAQANLGATSIGLQRTIGRLSSGFRINQSGDDAAGLAVANAYRSTQAVLNQGIRNANDALSTLQIKDGAMNNIATLLDRAATLATQATAAVDGSATMSGLNAEFISVLAEIDREAAVAGLTSNTFAFSVFISNETTTNAAGVSNGRISGVIGAADTSQLGLSGGTTTNISTAANAANMVDLIARAVSSLGTSQGTVGALQNRLQFAVTLAGSQAVNSKAAESRVRDANIAEESANLTRYNILTQSGIAALSQANQSSQAVLALLR